MLTIFIITFIIITVRCTSNAYYIRSWLCLL